MNSESFVNYILAKEKTPSPGTKLLKEVKISSEVLHNPGNAFDSYLKKSLIVYDKYFRL